MERSEIIHLIEEIINERGVPRNIKSSLENSILILNSEGPEEEKLAHVTAILDEASTDPNISPHTRTRIWNVVSIVEEINNHKQSLGMR
ncbi:MAG: UPF0147 family protein [Candidatus Aenigmatarchaeota archaeon]